MSKLLRTQCSKILKTFGKSLLAIFAIALVFRIIGITHGFPFIYNVDEPALMRSSYQLRFELNPKHFDWPHLHFYINGFFYFLIYVFRGGLQVIGLRGFVEEFFPILWRDPLVFYLGSRLLNALIGALTVFPVFFIAKNLYSRKFALLSAFSLAVFPYHVWASHFALIDVPMLFWFSLSMYFASKVAKKGQLSDYLFAGVFTGFSASTKYNGAFGAFVIILAHLQFVKSSNLLSFDLYRSFFNKISLRLVYAGISCVAAFIIGTPYSVLDYDTFLISDSPKGALWQFTNVGKVFGTEYIDQLKEVLTGRFIDEYGFVYLVGFVTFFIYFLITKKTKEKVFLFLPGLFYFLYVTSFDKNRMHYYLLVFPSVVMSFSYLVLLFLDRLIKSSLLRKLFLTLMFVLPVLVSVNKSFLLSIPDTRNVAFEWINTYIPSDSSLYYQGGDLDALASEFSIKPKRVSSVQSIVRNPSIFNEYVVVASNESISDKKSLQELLVRAELVKAFGSQGRLGPNIYVFRLD